MSDFLVELEAFPDLEGSIIRTTKIHKVLRGMIKLPSIPLDEEYNFKSRSIDLLAKWNDTLSVEPNAAKADDKGEATPAKTNGATKESEEAEKGEAEDAVAPETESKEAIKNKIGTTVEGEEEANKAAKKDSGSEGPVGNVKTDEPNIENAPEEEYKPPAETVESAA